MNIYEVCPRWLSGWSEDKNGDECLVNVVWHIVAETRNKAKAFWINEANGWGDSVEWIDPIGVKMLAKDVDLPEGIDEDYLWAKEHLPDFKVLDMFF